jgi:hypothetical protein
MVIPKIYYQYELAHFKGNMGHDATSDEVNSLTAKSVPARTKNSRPVGFYSRNSTKSTVNPNTTIP